VVLTLAQFLRPDRPVDLPLVVCLVLRNTVRSTILPSAVHQFV
jgi:hypothetical protein